MSNSSFQKAEKFFEVPVMISVLMLIPVLVIEYTQQTLEPVALYLNWGIWTVFLVEYVVLFYFSENKIDFIKSHKIELIIVIFSFPIVPEGLESSGFLRFARLPRLLNALRFFRLAALLNRFAATVKAIFNSKGLRFIVYATIAIVLFFGFLFYISEPDVQTYSDGGNNLSIKENLISLFFGNRLANKNLPAVEVYFSNFLLPLSSIVSNLEIIVV